MTDHPHFPFGMAPDVRRLIADEVDVLLAGFPSKRSLEVAITAYAEQLAGFDNPQDVHEGFVAARKGAGEFAPNPARVRACVAIACRQRRERVARPAPHSETPDFCMNCHTPDLIERANGRLMPLHRDDCPGLHESDQLERQHALATDAPIWRNGAAPKDFRTTQERLRARGLLPPVADSATAP